MTLKDLYTCTAEPEKTAIDAEHYAIIDGMDYIIDLLGTLNTDIEANTTQLTNLKNNIERLRRSLK